MRADMHVHSRFSDHPSEWFLQRLGASESYTDPETVYAMAKSRGMDVVALTDHNCIAGALELAARHDDVIVGTEVTTYFPDDGCKVHVLVWGLSEWQFASIQGIRHDVVALRDFLRDQDLAHSVAHATFAVNDRLTPAHLEKLVVLFDVFETVNGARTRRQNTQLQTMLDHLTPALVTTLSETHGIQPFSENSWIKGYTGGSDDHAGLLIGRAWTEAAGASTQQFLRSIASRQSRSGGRHNDSTTLAFSVYKIASEFSRSRTSERGKGNGGGMAQAHDLLFGEPTPRLSPKRLSQRLAKIKASRDPIAASFMRMAEDLERARHLELDDRLQIAYENVADISDELLTEFTDSVTKSLASGDVISLVRSASAALPVAFFAAPFVTSAGQLARGRTATDLFAAQTGLTSVTPPKTLWFTDTLEDLNGVAVTLRQVAARADAHDLPVTVVTSGSAEPQTPGRVLRLPAAQYFDLPYYESYRLGVPSVLRSLRLVQEVDPDSIVVSTPGPTGLFGAACAKILGIPLKMVFHTDFTAQTRSITKDESLTDLVDAYQDWFYRIADEVLVPTPSYLDVLLERGYDRSRLRLFRRGVDTSLFVPLPTRDIMLESLGLADVPTLLFVGRLSPDKDLDVLIEAYRELTSHRPGVNLVFAGDGPYKEEIVAAAAELPGLCYAGVFDNEALPALYSAADLLVFPSRTDTFGMVVLEAQSCGLPALVSDAGGPKDIVRDGVTGTVVREAGASAWAGAIETALRKMECDPVAHDLMRMASRTNALDSDWATLIEDVAGVSVSQERDATIATTSQERRVHV
ncbi:MAG: glycosyltransferase [Actinobacteria bacterium]|nr:glycosyltransferase [Actinomycetota bacterium]